MATDMLTNIENNVKLHFLKYVNRFVNSSFKKVNNDLIEKAKEGTKTQLRKELNKDVYEIKQDLINNTLKSNEKYHNWINLHRNNIFYKDFINSYEFDIQKYCPIDTKIKFNKIYFPIDTKLKLYKNIIIYFYINV
jgi:hypothetical protein